MPTVSHTMPFDATLSAYLGTLSHLITAGMLVSTLDGEIVLVNSAACTLLGLPADASAATCAAWFSHYMRDRQGRPFPPGALPQQQVAHGTPLQELDLCYQAPDAPERRFRLNGQQLCDGVGQPQAILLLLHAVSPELVTTTHQYADLQNRFDTLTLRLARQAAQFQTVISSLPDGVTVVDTAGNILHMNEVGQRILGQPLASDLTESVQRYDVRTLAGDPMSPADLPLARALRGEQVFGMEHLIRGKSGEDTRITVSANPVRSQEGEIIGAVAIFRDVTRRRQQEQEREQRLLELEGLREIAQATALARKETTIYEALVVRLAHLLQTETCVLLMRDGDNENFHARAPAYGIVPDQLARFTLRADQWTSIREHVELDCPQVIDTRDGFAGSVGLQLLQTFGVDNMILSRLTVRERVIGLIVACNKREEGYFDERDIRLLQTVTPQAALAIENSRLYMHARQISTEARAQARHLSRINDELDAFTYSVSHDLRAPLRAITGFTHLLERSLPELSERSRHHLTRIQVNVDKMGNLIDALLAFSRAGRQNPERAPVNTRAVVQEALRLYAQNLVECGAHVYVAELPFVQGDSRLLEQVFSNLISNAIKYRRPDTPLQLQITGTQDDGMVTLQMRDNGIGFDMRYHDKIFQVFQRLNAGETTEGTGIGLALVRKIIERHDGRIWAEGTPGVGSTFFIELPVADERKEYQRDQ